MRANREKSELLNDLSLTTMEPVEVLERLSNCLTPSSSLFKQAVDEFSFRSAPSRAQKVDDLERESVVQCAKKEVELQQLLQKLERMKSDGVDINGRLARQQEKLNGLNRNMDKLTHLLEVSGYHEEAHPTVVVDPTLNDEIPVVASLPLDDAKYKELWKRNVELQETVLAMKEQLKEVQARQMVAFRARGRQEVLRRAGRTSYA
jgi:hypothetical protein